LREKNKNKKSSMTKACIYSSSWSKKNNNERSFLGVQPPQVIIDDQNLYLASFLKPPKKTKNERSL